MFRWMLRTMIGMPPRPEPVDDSLTRVELARLEGSVAALVNELRAHRESVQLTLADHEQRIRVNDRWRLAMPATALTSISALIIAFWHH